MTRTETPTGRLARSDPPMQQIPIRTVEGTALRRAFIPDVHTRLAMTLFHLPYTEVTPELRRKAKAINYTRLYGVASCGFPNG